MAKTDQFTAKQVIDALIATSGMKTKAAQRLGCTYNTIQRYVKTYPSVAEALQEAHEKLGDNVELTLMNEALGQRDETGKLIREPNTAALIFLAKTKFKSRGFVERQEVVNFNVPTELIQRAIEALESAQIDATDFFNKAIAKAEAKRAENNGSG
jgi:hypothetical protein